MPDERQIRKYRKLVSELLYWRVEEQHLESLMPEMHRRFNAHYADFCRRHNLNLPTFRPPPPKAQSVEKANEGDSDAPPLNKKPSSTTKEGKLMSKIYKSVALELHPDKLIGSQLTDEEKKKKADVFKSAASAFDSSDWGGLLEVSEDLGLDVEVSDTLLGELEKEITRYQRKIKIKQITFSWALDRAPTMEEKDLIIRKFIKRIFKLEVL